MLERQKITGFSSPCQEYAEEGLSLDSLFIRDKVSTYFLRAGRDYPHFYILKDDLILIERGRTPLQGAPVVSVINNEFTLSRYYFQNGAHILMPQNKVIGTQENGDDFIFGVIKSIHRKF